MSMTTDIGDRNAEGLRLLTAKLLTDQRSHIVDLAQRSMDRQRWGAECSRYRRDLRYELGGSYAAADLLVAALASYRASFRWGDSRDAAQAQRNTLLDDIAAMASAFEASAKRDG